MLGAMNGRQQIMALSLAAVLLALVIATAARTQPANLEASQVEVSIGTRASDSPNDARVTTKAKAPLQRSSLPEGHGSIWNRGPAAYDLTLTSQASIYVLYTPR